MSFLSKFLVYTEQQKKSQFCNARGLGGGGGGGGGGWGGVEICDVE